MIDAHAVVDREERSRALDPSRSFVVQAPAGSGKTGLLIQRYLRLLAVVDRPEEILAITFTRKAAAEMRRRVLEALARGRDDAPPEDEHHRQTWQLARAALARDAERSWRMEENATRLRIQTIDSLCAGLSRQMPVLSRLGAAPAIVEDAREIFHAAAEQTLALVEGQDETAGHVARLLTHLDGNWAAASELLERMLGKRDQWIRWIAGLRLDARARAALEGSFQRERARLMLRARKAFPLGAASELGRILGFEGLPEANEDGADTWQAIVNTLLTAKPEFRKKVDKNQGFPPGDPRKPDTEALLKALAGEKELADALHAVRLMPPATYTQAQWEALGAVVHLLPLALAQLTLAFASRGEMDFTGMAQGAVTALGTPDQPTDLLLALDVRLAHVLVDEFQDTSLGQWELLTRLTAGWSPGDGRTIFLVGDPMQSIYRFREAQVALFLRAWNDGLGDIELEGIRLKTNFRSQGGLVRWFNGEFPRILAAVEDTDEGAVPYAEAAAHAPEEPGPAVTWHPLLGTDSKAADERESGVVVQIVRQALLEDVKGDVAILVRSRTHLDRIVLALKRAGIAFRAVDIEPLAGRQVCQDLLALARALSHPADRVAWLALLRAPWCALSLADLLALTGGTLAQEGARATVWELLADERLVGTLSGAGQKACVRVRERLSPFVGQRLRASLAELVESAWLALAGPACVERASDLDDAQTFFDQLTALEEAGELADPVALEKHLAELHAAPDLSQPSRVQLMTIHKAKGLEFSTVIVPGLGRKPRPSLRGLFEWKARADGTVMMAPVRATGEKSEPASDYLRGLENAANRHELERLFYVAATRARKRLHLLGYARLEGNPPHAKRPASTLLLGTAWSAARPDYDRAAQAATPGATPAERPALDRGTLRVLGDSAFAVAIGGPALAAPPPRREAGSIEFSWVGETARHVGTIAHRWLQRIAIDGLARWDAVRVRSLAPVVRNALARRAVPADELDGATGKVLRALERAIADDRGRWILGVHPEAHCEYRMRVARPEGVRLMVVDRLFREAGGALWVVDYKTGAHEGADVEGFLDAERERYAEQLRGYGLALAGRGPVRLGLYFPLLGGWREIGGISRSEA